jgi:glycosyltransferase involved in cell wall biosynthesis
MAISLRKCIDVSIPCRNEEGNILPLTAEIIRQFEDYLPEYDFQIQFIDNASNDKTREEIKTAIERHPNVRAIFNAGNFRTSAFYGMMQMHGDAVIYMSADFQDPPEMILTFVREWEKGAQVVCGIKTSSEENKVMWAIRTLYYKLIDGFSDTNLIHHFTSFAIYDKSFMEIVSKLNDPFPMLRGYVAEFCPDPVLIEYRQPKRRSGKSKNNFFRLMDIALRYFMEYSKIGSRFPFYLGILSATTSVLVGIIYLVMKLLYWDRFVAGMAPILIGMFFLGGLCLFCIGFLGEYLSNISARLRNKPLVIEKERVGFEKEQ